MRFFIADDDEVIRSMLTEIIEDYDLGYVVGECENGLSINSHLLKIKNIDILIIDLLMPLKDGLQTVNDLRGSFDGNIIMISQIEDKEMIGKAYSLGVEYYITKPINRIEVINVIEKVIQNIKLKKSIHDIQNALSFLQVGQNKDSTESTFSDKNITIAGQFLLTELGMIGESGSKDLLSMLEYLYELENEENFNNEFPPLKDIFVNIATKKLCNPDNLAELKKEIKASEQRVRRTIFQALNHLASLGLTDYSNPKFEEYAAKFFDFTEVRKKMLELETESKSNAFPIRINTKKFVKVLYLESKKRL